MNDQTSDGRVSEEKAALILDRAAQLDAKRGREVSVEELREAALEAGISPEAFERALAEVRAARVELADQLPVSPTAADEPRGKPGVLYRASLLATGAAIGGLALLLWKGFGLGDAGIIFSLLIALFVAIGLMFKRRREGSVLNFELDLAVFWVGLTFILMLGEPEFAEQVLARMGVMGGLGGLVGGAFVAMARPAPPKQIPDET